MKNHAYKVRTLTSDLHNPRGDKRYGHNWLCKPLWPKGMRLLVFRDHEDRRQLTVLSVDMQDYYTCPEGCEIFDHLMEASQPLDSEDFTIQDVKGIALNVYDCTTEEALDALVDQRVLTPAKILETVQFRKRR